MRLARASGKLLSTKQKTDIPDTKALIKGLPTWHLTGVTDAAVPAIRDTGFWVVFRLTGIGMRCAIICRLVPFEASKNAKVIINYSPRIVM